MKGHRGTERRREHRFPLSRELEYRVVRSGAAGDTFHTALSVDVSRRGLRLLTSEPLYRGIRLEVYLLAEDRRPKLSGLVVVVRCVRRAVTEEYFNQYYNWEAQVEYEVGLRSPGSVLFDRILDIT